MISCVLILDFTGMEDEKQSKALEAIQGAIDKAADCGFSQGFDDGYEAGYKCGSTEEPDSGKSPAPDYLGGVKLDTEIKAPKKPSGELERTVYDHLKKKGIPLNRSDVQKQLKINQQQATGTIQRLIQKGFLVKVPDGGYRAV